MKTLFVLSLLIGTSAHAELTSSALKACAYFAQTDDAFITTAGKEKGVRYIFQKNELYAIKMPAKRSSFALPAKFVAAKGKCYSETSSGPTDSNDCAKNVAPSFTAVTGRDLETPYIAVLDSYRETFADLLDDARENGKTNPEAYEARAALENFRACRSIGAVGSAAREYGEISKLADSLEKALPAEKPHGGAAAGHGRVR